MENNLNLTFTKLTEPVIEYVEALNKWENDPALIPLIHVCRNEDDLKKVSNNTLESVSERLKHGPTYLIHLDGELIGEMGYQTDPQHLYKKVPGTAWVGITIGEEIARGKGIGFLSLQYLEEQAKQHGLKRMELGVFAFNAPAIKLYQKLGFKEIGRIEDFSYWNGKMWQDVRMEKYLTE